jgi:hypothetical protein
MTDFGQLRARAQGVLTSQICNQIRFKLDNVRIQSFMFGYIGTAIGMGRIKFRVGGGNGYDHKSNTMFLMSEDVPSNEIVHEATHAIIDATNPGLTITKGTGEAAAYLAETVYSIVAFGEPRSLDVRFLTRPVAQLARELIAFNSNPKVSFVCPDFEVSGIKAILRNSRLVGDINRLDRMDGIGD